MSCTHFQPEGSSSGIWLYVQEWYNLLTCQRYKQSCRWYSVFGTKVRTCTYNRLPEDEPLGSKHVEDIVTIKMLSLTNVHFVSMFHLAFFHSIIDKHQHMHFTFNNILV